MLAALLAHSFACLVGYSLVALIAVAPPAQQPAEVTPAAPAGITPELVTRLVQRSPAFVASARSTPEVGQLLPIPRSPALYTQISWEEEGRRRAAIVTVGPVNAAPGASFLVELDGVGLLHLVEDLSLDEAVTALETALNVGRQRRTMSYMSHLATANDTMRVDTGRYAASVSELAGTGGPRVPETDGWGNPWVYVAQGGHYSLISRGSDGVPGPLPPDEWPGEPFEPDLLVVDGGFVHWPWPLTEIPEGNRLERRLFEPWRVVYRRQVKRQETTVSLMRLIMAANETRRAETDAYAAELEDLRTGLYAPLNMAVDAWGNPFMYRIVGSSYMLVSLGCDGAPGPDPPEPWEGMPCEPDIVVFDRSFSQAPAGR